MLFKCRLTWWKANRERSSLVASLTRCLFKLVWQYLYWVIRLWYTFPCNTYWGLKILVLKLWNVRKLNWWRFNQLIDRFIFSDTKHSKSCITTSQCMNRWDNFKNYARIGTTQIMNRYVSPAIHDASNRPYQQSVLIRVLHACIAMATKTHRYRNIW